MIRKTLTSLLFAAVWLPCFAQEMSFDAKNWDFGAIREADGPVSHTFTFTNTGNKPVVLEGLEVSCGCTSGDFSKRPVMPGQKGQLTITFDPINRPGSFNKTAMVTANNRSLRVILSVSGTVIERERPVEELYPVALSAGVRLNGRTALIRNVGQGESRSTAINWVNTSSRAVSFSLEADPKIPYLRIDAPSAMPAGGSGSITFTVDLSRETSAYGLFQSLLYPVIDGARVQTPISVKAAGVDDFGPSPEVSASPRARFDNQYKDFGELSAGGGKRSAQLTLTNSGTKPLIIRYTGSTEGLSTDLKAGTVIDPSKTVQFSVTIDPGRHSKGYVSGIVTIIVNDPLRPVREIRVAATIK